MKDVIDFVCCDKCVWFEVDGRVLDDVYFGRSEVGNGWERVLVVRVG